MKTGPTFYRNRPFLPESTGIDFALPESTYISYISQYFSRYTTLLINILHYLRNNKRNLKYLRVERFYMRNKIGELRKICAYGYTPESARIS